MYKFRSISRKESKIKNKIDIRSKKIGQYDQKWEPVKKFPKVLMIFFSKISGNTYKNKKGNDNTYSGHIKLRSPQDEIRIHLVYKKLKIHFEVYDTEFYSTRCMFCSVNYLRNSIIFVSLIPVTLIIPG